MGPILWVHRVNNLFCLCLGLSLNSLLIALIAKGRSRYSQILLQTAIIDMAVLILAEIVQPVFFVRDGVGHDLQTGLLSWLPNPSNNLLFLAWFFTFYFSIVGLGVQFIYRYTVICRGAKCSTRRYFAILCLAFVCQLPLMFLLAKCSFPNAQFELMDDPEVLRLIDNGPIDGGIWRLALRTESTQFITRLWFALFMLNNSTLYAIIFFCAIRIRLSLAKQIAQFEMSKMCGELNGQITRTLLVQSFLPIFPLILCSIGACSIVLSPTDSNGSALLIVQMLITVPFGWIPVANPLVTLIVVHQYRKWLWTFGKKFIGKVDHPHYRTNQSASIRVWPRNINIKI